MLVLTLGLVCAGSWGCGDAIDVPTAVVEQRSLVHKVSAEGRLQAARRTPITVPSNLPSSARLSWIAVEGAEVKAGDLVARFDRMSIEQMLEQGQDEASVAHKRMAKIDIETDRDIAALRKDLAVAEEQLEHAREFLKTDQGVFSRRDILEDAIDEELAEDRKQHAETAADLRREVASKERQLLEIEARQAQLKIDRADRALESLEARAPHDGIVTLIRDWNGEVARVGREMWPGQPVAEIPDLSTMEAEIYVLEADAGGVAEGLRAEVVVDAHPDVVHAATVARMEALAQPKKTGSPVQYFGVVLSFDVASKDPSDSSAAKEGIELKPGQRVTATLYLASHEHALVVPRQAIRQRGDAAEVWLREGNRFATRSVTLGTLTPGLAMIESGLAAGDVVALAEPPSSLRTETADDGNKASGGSAATGATR